MLLAEESTVLSLADWLGVTATVIAVLGIVIGYVLYRRSKDTKLIQYSLLEDQSLETNAPFPGLVIEVSYMPASKPSLGDGDVFQSNALLVIKPHIWKFKIKNIGKLALRPTDFETPLEVKPVDGEIVDVYVQAVSHEGMREIGAVVDGFMTGPTVDVTPRLMNSGDWVEILVLTDRATKAPVVAAWIVAETRPIALVSEEALAKYEKRKYRTHAAAVGVPAAFALIVAITLMVIFVSMPELPAFVGWLIILIIFGSFGGLFVAAARSEGKSISQDTRYALKIITRRH